MVSNTGTWFQNLAVAVIVVQATGSASALAFVTVAQFGPTALLGGFAGRLADRVSPRLVVLGASIVASAVTVALALWVSQGSTDLLPLYLLIMGNGICYAFDRVASQTLVYELVGPNLLQNGVVLTTMLVSAGRSIGPALAGISLILIGPAWCLGINAVSFMFAAIMIASIRPSTLHQRVPQVGDRQTFSETLSRVRSNPGMRTLLTVNVIVALFAISFTVVISAVVLVSFRGDAGMLGAVHSFNAIGALIAGLLLAGAKKMGVPALLVACLIMAFASAVGGIVPTLALFVVVAPLLGFAHGYYQAVIYSAAQNSARPSEIGRTMSLVTMTQIGLVPIGALWAGLIVDLLSGQAALLFGAAACSIAALVVLLYIRRLKRSGATI